jgi:hypothetical protein
MFFLDRSFFAVLLQVSQNFLYFRGTLDPDDSLLGEMPAEQEALDPDPDEG